MKDGKKSVFIVYLDDMIITRDDIQEIENLKKRLRVEILGYCLVFLGYGGGKE